MGWFSKEEKVPEIQPAATLPELPKREEEKGLPELPSFPNNSQNNNITQEMVKSAVSDNPSPGENEVHVDIPEGLHISEEPKEESMIPPRPSEESIPNPPVKKTLELSASILNKPITREAEPIFVRIDKFQSAQKNFEQIKDKTKEIESILGKIKDIKSKEEVEIKGWSEDIEKIKARLAEIDSDIFNQI